jgi:hypothetical protein
MPGTIEVVNILGKFLFHEIFFVFVLETGSLYCPGWPQTPGLKGSSCLSLSSSWNCEIFMDELMLQS